jgi:ribosomal protein S18 acetylase RimI-like enzyme
MAYQFFTKAQAQQQRSASSPPVSPPPALNRPPIHPPPLVLPPSAAASAFSKKTPPASGDTSFKLAPFPDSNPASYPTPHPHVTIDPVRTVHIPSLARITGLLLPIRYPNSFYTACITDPVIASLSRVAVYHDHFVSTAPEPSSVEPTFAGRTRATPSSATGGIGTDKVVGGIRCRLERLHSGTTVAVERLSGRTDRPPTNLYIQTLHLLSPHRGNGVAASLLNALLFEQPPSSSSCRVSPLVRHYNIRTVTAHVHETNDEGLKWYVARGFYIEEGVVQGYYRRLNPGGARIVRLDLQWNDDEDQPQQSELSNVQEARQTENREDEEEEEDGWEKVEADDEDDHGVEHLADSRTFDSGEDSQSTAMFSHRKRKADEELRPK